MQFSDMLALADAFVPPGLGDEMGSPAPALSLRLSAAGWEQLQAGARHLLPQTPQE